MENKENRKHIAKSRWKILKRALINHQVLDEKCDILDCSIRRFNNFSLFERLAKDRDGIKMEDWIYKDDKSCYSIRLAEKLNAISYEDITAFDNTGNVCIWGSEEVMAFYCMENIEKFIGKSICELGGGFSNLAGLFLAKNGNVKEILLTDGNEKSINHVNEIININITNELKNKTTVSSKVIRFDNPDTYQNLNNNFDYILCADCLFFDKTRLDLVNTIYNLLTLKGKALIFAPKRGKTFDEFCEMSKEKFGEKNVKVTEKYNEKVWDAHISYLEWDSYLPDLHYPFLIEITKVES